jgi:hypothetical protein
MNLNTNPQPEGTNTMTTNPIDLLSVEEPRPTISFPTVSLPDETRIVSRPRDSSVLVTTSTWKGATDWDRMTAETERDCLIFPSWSDGTEHLIELADGDRVEFAGRFAENQYEQMETEIGLSYVITDRYGNKLPYTIEGYARVTVAS